MGKFYEADLKAKHFSFGLPFLLAKKEKRRSRQKNYIFYGADVRAKHFSFGVTFSFSKEKVTRDKKQGLFLSERTFVANISHK